MISLGVKSFHEYTKTVRFALGTSFNKSDIKKTFIRPCLVVSGDTSTGEKNFTA